MRDDVEGAEDQLVQGEAKDIPSIESLESLKVHKLIPLKLCDRGSIFYIGCK